MRVHGDKIIQRRAGMQGLAHYNDARLELAEDFGNMCGYCGKNDVIMMERFHIDHFVPKSLASERKDDYYNLVWSCPKCNLSKSNKWPTKDKRIPNNGKVGFVDPATEEYDEHLERDDKGFVKGITDLGEDMCRSLHLDVRRTDLYWKIQNLYRLQAELEELNDKNELEKEELQYYMKSNIFLKKYIKEAFEKGE